MSISVPIVLLQFNLDFRFIICKPCSIFGMDGSQKSIFIDSKQQIKSTGCILSCRKFTATAISSNRINCFRDFHFIENIPVSMVFSRAYSSSWHFAKCEIIMMLSLMCVTNWFIRSMKGQWAIWINGFQSFSRFIDDFMCEFRSVNDVIATYI